MGMMRLTAILLFFCFFGIALSALSQVPVPPEDELIVKARAFIEALRREDFKAAARDFDATEDFANWKKALGGRPDVEFKLYPKANHLFIEGQGLPTPNEYVQVHGSVAEAVVSDIAAFISRH